MHSETKLNEMSKRAYNYLNNKAFPKWLAEGVFTNGDGFVEEFFLNDSKPNIQSFRRLRVQGRQTWTFAMAAALGYDGKLLWAAQEGWKTILTQFSHTEGGFIHSVNPDGTPLNEERFLYEQAFVLLGAAGLYTATKDQQYLDEAKKLYSWINEAMKAEEGFYTSYGNPSEPRQQNPHMHSFEALMALYVASGDGYWLKEATKIYQIYNAYFYDKEYKLLREFFNSDWKSYDAKLGDSIEPGHNYEWVWLLNHYKSLTKEANATQDELYNFALSTTADNGFAYDECLPDGKIKRKTSRLWVQTEALKANLAQYETHKDDIYITRAEACFNNIFDYYLHDNGLWGDQQDADLKELSKVTPASTFYHIFLAFIEVIRMGK
ncbi:MAG: AGE family epimerase/isomerase [Alphaproteobacteria bacterium]